MSRRDQLTDLRTALRRLGASDTPVKRRNARKAFDQAMKALQKQVDAEYPKLRKDGSPITQRKPSGAFCPICRTPLHNNVSLVRHLFWKHPNMVWIKVRGEAPSPKDTTDPTTVHCCCGLHTDMTSMAKHFASMKDVGAHFANEVMRKSAGLRPSKLRDRFYVDASEVYGGGWVYAIRDREQPTRSGPAVVWRQTSAAKNDELERSVRAKARRMEAKAEFEARRKERGQ